MSKKENGVKAPSSSIKLQSFRKIGVMEQTTNNLHQGPDEVIPTSKTMTWDRSDAVMLRMSDKGQGAEKPISVMSALRRTAQRVPTRIALSWKEDSKTKQMTFKKYYENVQTVAKAFIKLGLQPEHGVGIIGFNSPEWFISDLAAIFAGGFATGIYTTNSAEACFYILDDAQCDIVVVENDAQLKKILEIKDRLPNLKAIVQYKDSPPTGVYSWADVMKLGASEKDLEKDLEERIKAQAPNKCCTLVYTSGTTGNSKGVMLSHDNMTWTVESVAKMAKIQFGGEEVVTYLPLSHAAAQMLDLMMPVCFGATVHFAQPDALKGSLGETLREVRPTVFLGVPRVWEKMQEAMVAVGKKNGPVKKWIAGWAKDIGLKTNMAKMNGQSKSICFSLANTIVFKKVRLALGFDRCHFFLSGAAPISRVTLEFFLSLNINISEVYGMSESSGPHTVCLPWESRLTSVGKEFPGAKTLLAEPDKEGNGEICMGGRHVFMGYLNMEDKTREALDDDGWLHSGDVGKKDKDGFLFITGRIKELIITAGGENIPPVLIEDKVKEFLPCVSNCMLIGDKRKFLALLITLKTEVDRDSQEPLDQLSAPALDWCKEVGSSSTTVSQILKNKDTAVLKAIEAGIQKVNKTSTSRAQCIQKWSIVPRDFSIPGGELGPTLKLKRPVVAKMYEDKIEEFYQDGE